MTWYLIDRSKQKDLIFTTYFNFRDKSVSDFFLKDWSITLWLFQGPKYILTLNLIIKI